MAGLAFVRGQSTEITTYDNDGYLVGERLSVRRPKNLFFDEVSATLGYFGDLSTPSFTSRYRRLDEINYGHVLVSRKAAAWLSASADYTRLSSVSTFRTAVTVKTRRAGVVDLVRYEQYARGGGSAAFGFAACAEKTAHSRVTMAPATPTVDLHYGGLNADRFNKGRRVYATGTVKLTPELSASLFAAQAVHNAGAIANSSRVDVILTYNALATLTRTGVLR